MARVKLTEFKSKSLLVKNYRGIEVKNKSIDASITNIVNRKRYILKVDQGVKKRGKLGLVKLNVTKNTIKNAIRELSERGYDRFLVEPMVIHDESEEKYFSIERVREGFKILYSQKGGMDIEEHHDSVTEYDDIDKVPLPQDFINHVIDVMNNEHLSFVEINPLLVRNDECILLDAAVLADSAGSWISSWSEADVVEARQKIPIESSIEELDAKSPASFSFRLLNEQGSIWLLLSGGGASITIADEAANIGKSRLIGNFGEYSGGPTLEETQLYAKSVLHCAIRSEAKTKAVIIGGGVANFTDVKKTFSGIIEALKECMDDLNKQEIKIFVRRGGPNEQEGLALMKAFLKKHNLYGSVHGSDAILTTVVDEALEYVNV